MISGGILGGGGGMAGSGEAEPAEGGAAAGSGGDAGGAGVGGVGAGGAGAGSGVSVIAVLPFAAAVQLDQISVSTFVVYGERPTPHVTQPQGWLYRLGLGLNALLSVGIWT